MSLGVELAAERSDRTVDVRLAVDSWQPAIDVFRSNFSVARAPVVAVETLFDGVLGSKRLTASEKELRSAIGTVDLLVGGPPCQGYSDLNNHSRRRDPRNRLYARMARAAEVLTPGAVLIENVPAVVHDEEEVVAHTSAVLERAGYDVMGRVLDMSTLGLPQTRKRHLLLGIQRDRGSATAVLDAVVPSCSDHLPKTVRWAIEDLVGVEVCSELDRPSRVSNENLKRMRWLMINSQFDLPNRMRPLCHRGDHSYKSMYGRLRWDEPAQTITTGFSSMGQGRYVHPSEQRTITPHEAARLQSFPDSFSFGMAPNRVALARLIGNAVPPLFAAHAALAILSSLDSGPSCRESHRRSRHAANDG